ncbi:MAG: hypothetical protein J0I42_12170 [Bosea sp.]|uniref:hypothetical protein n=1 Tax=Bosea sp. (in: a-proteobacteria) TaxID=1871050 RepID=UPI001ACA42EF|nr:hypothetical protein [Bosea sp. (in: a-proteobacteria)]MBN9452695.1 hypothetical protein [Bosea sp. (in: a-proteobacteria)]
MPNTTVPAAAPGLPQETLSAGWYLFRQPNGADRLLWLERLGAIWAIAVSPTLAHTGQAQAHLSDDALRAAAPRAVNINPGARSLTAWEATNSSKCNNLHRGC